jgi:hypothetical protein
MATAPKSRRSGGPQTPEGKLTSSRNSLKMGVYSKQEVLPGEDLQELVELEQYFMEDFAPQGITESAPVHDLTVLAWKKLRLERLEYRQLRDRLNKPADFLELESLAVAMPKGCKKYFDDPGLIAECDLEMAREHLKFCNRLKSAKFSLPALEAIHKDSLSTFVKIKRELEDLGASVTTAKNMVDCQYNNPADTTPLQDSVEEIISKSESIIWAVGHYVQIMSARQKIQDKRLASELKFDKSRRVNDDLDRFFFRTLSELRKQQEWRYRRDAIVMAQEVPAIAEGEKPK